MTEHKEQNSVYHLYSRNKKFQVEDIKTGFQLDEYAKPKFPFNTEALFSYIESKGLHIGALIRFEALLSVLSNPPANIFAKVNSTTPHGVMLLGFTPRHALLVSWIQEKNEHQVPSVATKELYLCPLEAFENINQNDILTGFISPKLLMLNCNDPIISTIIRTSKCFGKYADAVGLDKTNYRSAKDHCFYLPEQSYSRKRPVGRPRKLSS